MRRRCGLLLLFLLGATDVSAQTGRIPEGFTPLFNGKDLTGWHISRTTHQGTTGDVQVEDGVLILKQHPYGQGGLLMTDEPYEDFELYLEVKPDWGTNGGILFRATEGGSGYQIEVVGGGGDGTGNLLGEMLRVTTDARATDLQAVWKEDAWNALRLRVTGAVPRMTLWVNGVQMWDVTAVRNDLIADATRGRIALQTHWSATSTPVPGGSCCAYSWKPGAAHRYRNIAIRAL